MKFDSWHIPVLVIVSLVIFFTRYGLLGAVVINKPYGSAPVSTGARFKSWTGAIFDEIGRREISLVVGYGTRWHHDYFSWDVTALKLDSWSRRPWISYIPASGPDGFAIIRLNHRAVVLPPPLRVLLLALFYHLAWRWWQRERWNVGGEHSDAGSSEQGWQPRWNDIL